MQRALALRMGKTLRQLRREMSWGEFQGWVAFYLQEPFDDARCFDLGAARITQAMVNAWRPSNTDPYPMDLFMPFRPPPAVDVLESKILREL